ncbi:MAG: hypothetical protein ICCCNLDF_01667 [Planctomycetes bacterium]|nr:hypothetical protein [Planctomycetota bacterium]
MTAVWVPVVVGSKVIEKLVLAPGARLVAMPAVWIWNSVADGLNDGMPSVRVAVPVFSM